MKQTAIHTQVQALSLKQRKLLLKQLQQAGGEKMASTDTSGQQLVAYFVSDDLLAQSDLRSELKAQLPDYMVPAHFVQLDEFSRLPNGKVDLNALPSPQEAASWETPEFVEPRTPIEQTLADIWSSVLNYSPVGIHDNFFENGGDSIRSIQIISRARKEGIILNSDQLFDQQTIAEVAESLSTGKQAEVEIDSKSGVVAMMPIQHWFFEEHKTAPNNWNTVYQFAIPAKIDTEIVEKAIKYLIGRHDTLRLAFAPKEGTWQAEILSTEKINSFQQFTLTGSSIAEQQTAIDQHTIDVQEKFDLAAGSLFQCVYIDCGAVQNDQLLLVAHHLLMDGMSWQIFLDELTTICNQMIKGKGINLTLATASFRKKATIINEFGQSDAIQTDAAFWQAQKSTTFPTDVPVELPLREASIVYTKKELDAELTEQLLTNAGETYHTQTDELLMTALLKTLNKWKGVMDLCMGFEGYGRQTIDGNKINLSSSLGWFTSFYPVNLHMEPETDMGAMITSTKEQLRKVPNNGLTYGMLRYLSDDQTIKDGLQQRPNVIFNFLGDLIQLESDLFGRAKEIGTGVRNSSSERFQLLEFNAFIIQGKLNVRWSYSKDAYKEESIEELFKTFEAVLRELVDHCTQTTNGTYTPSDFPEVGLDQDDLNALLGDL